MPADAKVKLPGLDYGFLVQYGADRVARHGTHEQRVAVRRRRGHGCRANASGRAGTVVNDDLLAECDRQFLCHHPADHVSGSAGWIGYDQLDYFIRVLLRYDRTGDR